MIAIILFMVIITCSQRKPPSTQKEWNDKVIDSVIDIQIKESVEIVEHVFSPVTLKGPVTGEATTDYISITIDKNNNQVNGLITLWWYEDIEVGEEGGESHHSLRYTCVVKLYDGFVFGIIDENNNINAKISGFVYSDYGYPESGQSTSEISSLCAENIEKKSVDFILKGVYREDDIYAYGNVLPNGWSWRASQ